MKVRVWKSDKTDPMKDMILVAEFFARDGKSVCSGEPEFVKNWEKRPAVYGRDDVDHEDPLTPDDGDDYLWALPWWYNGSYMAAEILEDAEAEKNQGESRLWRESTAEKDRNDRIGWGPDDLQIVHRPKVNVKEFFEKTKEPEEDMAPLAEMEPEKKEDTIAQDAGPKDSEFPQEKAPAEEPPKKGNAGATTVNDRAKT